MDIGSEVVKQGRIGTGDAQVLGAPQDSIGNYMRGLATRPSAEAQAQAKKARDDKFDEWEEYEPGKIWAPYGEWQKEQVGMLRDFTLDAQLQGVDPQNERFTRAIKEMEDNISYDAIKVDAIKETYDEAMEYAKTDEAKTFYKEGVIKQQLRDYLFSDDGTAIRSPHDTDIKKKYNEVLNDPANFNVDGIVGTIMDKFGDETIKYYDQINTDNNMIVNETTEIKGKMFMEKKDANGNTLYLKKDDGTFQLDPEGNKIPQYETDEMGNPVPMVNEYTYPVFMRQPQMRKYLDALWNQNKDQLGLGDSPQAEKQFNMEAINQIMRGKVDTKVSTTAGAGQKRNNFNWGFGISGGMPKEDAENWFDILEEAYEGEPGAIGKFQDIVQDASMEFVQGKQFSDSDMELIRANEFMPDNPEVRIIKLRMKTKQYENVDIKPERREVIDGNGNRLVEVKDKNRNWRVNEIHIPIDGSQGNKKSVMGTLLNYLDNTGIKDDKRFTQVTMDKVWELREKENRLRSQGSGGAVYKVRTNNQSQPSRDGGIGYD